MKCIKRIGLIIFLTFNILAIFAVLFVLLQVIYVQLHPIDFQLENSNVKATCIYDNNLELVEKLGSNKMKSSYITDIPDIVKKSVISIEDKRFYEHSGVDVKRTISAIFSYILKFGKSDYGGSTITQQLVKNVSGKNERTVIRKVREWFYAIDIEGKYDKDFIITHYLNIIYWGNGIYGINDASKYYFNKEVSDLSINEIAYLVGIIQMPEIYIRDSDLANQRKNIVLNCMYEQGYISKEVYDESIIKDILSKEITSKIKVQSYFVDSVIDRLSEVLAKKYAISKDEARNRIYQGGYTIYSTIDSNIQKQVDNVYNNIEGVQSSMVIMTNDGKVVAIRGGTGYKTADMVINRALVSKRQPGSALKPLAIYAPALEEGIITKNSIVCDQSVIYGDWSPTNAYSGFRGDITVRKAIEISCNTVAVQVLEQLGISKSLKYLSNMEFELDEDDKNLSIALGGLKYGVTTLEMASGYQTLANNGVYCEPIFFEKVLDKDGNEIYNAEKERKIRRVFSENTVNDITDLLMEVVNGVEGTARNFKLKNCEVAAKTGTSNNVKDRWLCAYTPYYAMATWYGYDTPKTVQYSSKQVQLNTKTIFDAIHENVENRKFDITNNEIQVTICTKTNLLATEFCKDTLDITISSESNLQYCTECEAQEETLATEQEETIYTDSERSEFNEKPIQDNDIDNYVNEPPTREVYIP